MSNEVRVLSADDTESLKNAHRLLSNPSWVARAASMIGKPIEYGIDSLPDKAKLLIDDAVKKAMQAALEVALKTMNNDVTEVTKVASKASNWWHKAAVATTGAVGGAFGFAALAVELPISTTIMLRSIADVARSEEADLNDKKTQMECLQVLALGGPSKNDDDAEIGYFAVRQAMTAAVQEAAAHVLTHGASANAPALVRLLMQIAERFGITVTEKVLVQAIPVLGAIGGAAINTAFIDHFQDMAKGHFIVRRLETKYCEALVFAEYEKMSQVPDLKSLSLDSSTVPQSEI